MEARKVAFFELVDCCNPHQSVVRAMAYASPLARAVLEQFARLKRIATFRAA
jgi:hypothetical protein